LDRVSERVNVRAYTQGFAARRKSREAKREWNEIKKKKKKEGWEIDKEAEQK